MASAFLWTGFLRISGLSGTDLEYVCRLGASYFSTYYINMCIFLAFALTFPEAQVYLFFILPLKVKYLGWIDVGFLILSMISGNSAERFVIAAALLNVVLLLDFFLPNRSHNPQVQTISSSLPMPYRQPLFLVLVTAPV